MVSGLDALLSQQNAAASAASSSASSGTQQTSSSDGGIDANTFITLLTAQLKAQDPLDPMDPDQMVSELTAMNTLQQTIQMRQDLDALAGTGTASTSGSSTSGSNAGGSATGNTASAVQAANAYRNSAITNPQPPAGMRKVQ